MCLLLVRSQEVTLKKSCSQEQLGLTVSYIHCAAGSGGSGGGNNSVKSINEVDSEASTEVYISNIIPDSIAARDGRLRQGDQILQVSGFDLGGRVRNSIIQNKSRLIFECGRMNFTWWRIGWV